MVDFIWLLMSGLMGLGVGYLIVELINLVRKGNKS